MVESEASNPAGKTASDRDSASHAGRRGKRDARSSGAPKSRGVKRGPNTPAGKARSSQNALKHGLRSDAPVIPGFEDFGDWDRHRAGIMEALAPEGALETAHAARVAKLIWRLDRVPRYETAMMTHSLDAVGDDLVPAFRYGKALRYQADRAGQARRDRPPRRQAPAPLLRRHGEDHALRGPPPPPAPPDPPRARSPPGPPQRRPPIPTGTLGRACNPPCRGVGLLRPPRLATARPIAVRRDARDSSPPPRTARPRPGERGSTGDGTSRDSSPHIRHAVSAPHPRA